MSKLSPQKLFKQIQLSSNMKMISDFFNHSKVKISKQVYNLETRNIKLFVKQQRQMESKRKQNHALPNKRPVNQKGKYDQNQLLEFQYKFQNSRQNPAHHIQRSQTQPSQFTSNSDLKYRKVDQSNKLIIQKNLQSLENSKIFINRPKRTTQIQPIQLNRSIENSFENLPKITIRKKSKSTFDELNRMDIGSKLRYSNLQESEQTLKKSSSSIMQFSSKIVSKRKANLSYGQQTQEKLIQITDDKMIRYIKSLHTLVNGTYEYGSSLDEQKVNDLILERYTLARKCINKNLNKQIDKQSQSKKFQFPHMEFISEPETRKSIHQIINMSVKNTQRVVFKLLDFNRNGFIDQKDLLDLIEISQKISDLKSDLIKIVQYACKCQKFSISNANSMSYREDSHRQIEKMQQIPQRYQSVKISKNNKAILNPPNISKLSNIRQRTNTFSSSQMTEFITPLKYAKKDVSLGSTSFNKQRLYSFFQTKNKFFTSNKNKDEFRFTVNLTDFHRIFQNQRPSTFLDLMKFLFRVKPQDLIRQPVDETYSDSKLSKKHAKVNSEINQGFKNYDIPQIIKDMEKKFQCNIQMSKYQHVLNTKKISQRNLKKY